MDRVRRRVLVSGEVQAVGFRDSARQTATALGVGGWVRNRRDGSVEIEVEGAEPAVAALLAWAASGPPGAVVRTVDVTELELSGDRRFEIRA
jgi:acylphosphatase